VRSNGPGMGDAPSRVTVAAATANFGLRVPLRVLFDPELKPDEKVLFGFIAAVPKHNPSYDQISAELRFSRKRIARAIKGLTASGWLTPQHAPKRTRGGQWRSTGKTTYLLADRGGNQFVLMPPGVRRSLVQPRACRSSAAVLLLALYEQHRTARRHPQRSFTVVGEMLGVDRRTVARTREILTPSPIT
jgi:hypothetical protein